MTHSPADARSFWIIGSGKGEIRNETLREPNEDEVLVRTLYSGISRGTEALVINGAVPVSEFGRMRAPFQDGDFPAPVKYGYINVGIVEKGPASLQGNGVFCLYPHQTRYVVPATAVYRIPDDVPPQRAVLAANLEAAINGVWDGAPRLGDRIAVIGAGVLGCLSAWLCNRIPGCEVELIDINDDRERIASALSVAFATPKKAIANADLVIHATGTAEGLSTALELAGFEATVLELSWYGNRKPAVPLGEGFHSKRLTLRSSQVGTVATAQRSRWDHRRRMELALKLLSDARLDAMISGESRFEDLPVVMPAIAASAGTTLCHRIVY
jgi:Threonine dehydrogenase and related Zn-dependent dehydrogenases